MLTERRRTGDEDLSEYEKMRLEKIKRNKALLDSLFPDLSKSKENTKSSMTFKRKERRRTLSAPYNAPKKVSGPVVVRRNPGRKARNSLTPTHLPAGATVSEKSGTCALDDDYFRYEAKIRVYRSYVSAPVDIDLDSDEETDAEREERIRQMQKPARFVTEKKYDRVRGTTCHQCRQKTLDGKTKCNNKNCVGVRGQFCGVCLLNRYGEDAETAIADKTWVCPPCKGYCNCSVCLSKKGKAPTGILTPIVRDRGFNSVKDYLASLKDPEKTDDGEEESRDIELVSRDQSPVSRDPPSEMEYDDDNKENIDPLGGEEKENTAIPVVINRDKLQPLAPRIIVKDARARYESDQSGGSFRDSEDRHLSNHSNNDNNHSNDNINHGNFAEVGEVSFEDGDIDKIRRSTEKLNISQTDEGDVEMLSPKPARGATTARANFSKQSIKPRAVSRCLVIWQTSKYAGGHQWVSADRIPDLGHGKPTIGKKVQVKWGKQKNKFYPAILSKVEYAVKRRKSCRF